MNVGANPDTMIVHYQEYGRGRPLVILHGLLGSLDNWHTLSKQFSDSFRVLAVDQRNHGRSPHSDIFTYEAMAEDVAELLDHLNISSACVLGHSMGGKTAMQFALSHPERVRKLIVVDIAPRAYPHLHDEIVDALLSIDLRAASTRQHIDDELAKKIPDHAERQFLMKNLARDSSGAFMWKANLPAIHHSYREIAREISSERPYVGPTLFIKADRAAYILDSDDRLIKTVFPNARIVRVDAGHWIHAEAPTVFADLVLKFLES
jgi:esterase